MQTKKIKSVKDGSNPKPWYSVEVSSGIPEIAEDKDGGTGLDMGGGTQPSVPSFVDLPDPAQAAMQKDAIYAVTGSGEFIAYEPGTNLSEHGVSLRAHLAWYDSETDEFTVLEFIEE
jgi:hypothetical protein